MIIKSRDDTARDIETLEGFLSHPKVAPTTLKKIEKQIRIIKAGAKGEDNAAYYIDHGFASSQDYAIIHDLRLVDAENRVAQIDHLIIDRSLNIWVCESKNYRSGVIINEQGEFITFYNKRPQGMESPIEQCRRHSKFLKAYLSTAPFETPKAIIPTFENLVLFSPQSNIKRPDKGFERVIKADQIHSLISNRNEGSILGMFSLSPKASEEELMKFARNLAGMHWPSEKSSDYWQSFFKLDQTHHKPKPVKKITITRPVCASCGIVLSAGVENYCKEHAERFGNQLYCMKCQKNIPPLENKEA